MKPAHDAITATNDTARTRCLVIVLGMHRSGTSALTRGLQSLGVDLGDNLLPAVSSNNDKGFFEDADVYGLNRDVLAAVGSNWDDLALPRAEAFRDSAILRPLTERARGLLRRRVGGAEILAIKDPTFNRLLPFWKPLFDEAGLDVRYLVAVRNLLAVAQSLVRRDGFSVPKSACLGVVNVLSALGATHSEPRLFVDYDALMREPDIQLRRVAAFLGIEIGAREAAALHEYQTGFLDHSLRHFACSAADLAADRRVPRIAVELQELLCSLVNDRAGNAQSIEQRVQSLCERYEEIQAIVGCAGESVPPQTATTPPGPVVSHLAVYFAAAGQHYAEARSVTRPIVIGTGRQLLKAAIPPGFRRLRVDPAAHACLIRVWRIRLLPRRNGAAFDLALGPDLLRNSIDLLPRAPDASSSAFEIVSTGNDPQFELALDDTLAAELMTHGLDIEFDIELLALAAEVAFDSTDVLELARAVNQRTRALEDALQRACATLSAESERHSARSRSLESELRAMTAAIDDERARFRALAAESSRMQQDAFALRARIDGLERSTSWRVTAPLRALKRGSSYLRTHSARVLRPFVARLTRAAYRRAPLRPTTKLRIKSTLFSSLPGLFRHTRAYADWSRHSGIADATPAADGRQDVSDAATPRVCADAHGRDASFVGEARSCVAADPRVTAVAFYLPQFHPCAENDAWWGKGFTEWANVSRALPQFEGHYQPHLPGELGFYDLRVPEIQRRQVELARIYGIGAFCFYFYWFGGKTLLEMPLRRYRERQRAGTAVLPVLGQRELEPPLGRPRQRGADCAAAFRGRRSGVHRACRTVPARSTLSAHRRQAGAAGLPPGTAAGCGGDCGALAPMGARAGACGPVSGVHAIVRNRGPRSLRFRRGRGVSPQPERRADADVERRAAQSRVPRHRLRLERPGGAQ